MAYIYTEIGRNQSWLWEEALNTFNGSGPGRTTGYQLPMSVYPEKLLYYTKNYELLFESIRANN